MSPRCVDCLNEAIEWCEVTGSPVCAEHLWYVDDGRRVSERAAQQLRRAGRVVFEPAHYLKQLGAEFPAPVLAASPAPSIHILPNGADLLGWLAGMLSAASVYFAWRALAGEIAFAVLICAFQVAIAVFALRGAAKAVHRWQVRAFALCGLAVASVCLLLLAARALLS